MPTVYCELCDKSAAAQDLPKYVTFCPDERAHPYAGRFPIAMAASRIWVQDDDSIRYVKNRWDNPETAQVDLKEFMWVKLTSRSI
jgi:hypothetical protein